MIGIRSVTGMYCVVNSEQYKDGKGKFLRLRNQTSVEEKQFSVYLWSENALVIAARNVGFLKIQRVTAVLSCISSSNSSVCLKPYKANYFSGFS